MDPHKLEAARGILGASSETETVDKALDSVTFTHELVAAFLQLYEAGGVADIYAPVPKRRRRVTKR